MINLLKVILLHVIFSALKLCTKMVPTLLSLSPYFDIEGFPYKMSQFYFKWSGRSPGEGNGNLLQFFLPAEFHGQEGLLTTWSNCTLDAQGHASLFHHVFVELNLTIL